MAGGRVYELQNRGFVPTFDGQGPGGFNTAHAISMKSEGRGADDLSDTGDERTWVPMEASMV